MSKNRTIPSFWATSDADYAHFGLTRGTVEEWEDGLRTNGQGATYEWWYFDTTLDDGGKLVICFYTKNYIRIPLPRQFKPVISVQYMAPDGTYTEELIDPKGVAFEAATDHCDVHIGDNFFTGDLRSYSIRVRGAIFQADITLHNTSTSWRPETGVLRFGEKSDSFFAWLAAVPSGEVDASLTINGVTHKHSGTGYHDHNWGNVSMMKLLNHWYWGRASAGGYQVISSYITAEKRYGYKEFLYFLLTHDGKIVAESHDNPTEETLTFRAEEPYIDGPTGKPTHNRLVYEYEGAESFRVIYERESDTFRERFVDVLSRIQPLWGFLAKLMRIDGAYIRPGGTVTIEKIVDGKVVMHASNTALWELMYLGRTQK